MKCELVTATTSDLVRLNGLYSPADTRPGPQIDSAVVLHGLGGNFYSSKLGLRIHQTLLSCGVSSVLANTRGHDGISMNVVGGRAKTIGAAFETVADCRQDVDGWVQWLASRGHRQTVVVGHSLGAIKSLYSQAHQPNRQVTAIIGLSASRLCHRRFIESEHKDTFLHWLNLAESHVAQGQPDHLLNVDFPFPTYICAGAYVDKYGTRDRYDWLSFAESIKIPVLLVFGELELRDNAAFQGLEKDFERLRNEMADVCIHQVASADHFYSGVHHRVSEVIQNWVQDLNTRAGLGGGA